MKPNDPAPYDATVVYAVRAFMEGKASESQQITVRDWILHVVCQVEGMAFTLGGEDGRRLTDFADGKRYCGNQIRKMSNPITLEALERAKLRTEARGKK
jgi:hypothetical protein